MKHHYYYPESERYSATRACVVALARPVRAVTRGDHLPMWKAWLVHVAGAVMAVGVLMVLTAWSDVQGTATPVQVAGALLNNMAEVVVKFQNVTVWIGLIFTVLFVEFTTGLAALGAMSWCAREEKFLASYGRALRRLWLVTPHAATVIALAGGVVVWIERMSWNYSGMFDMSDVPTLLSPVMGGLWYQWVILTAMGCRVAPAMCLWPARCKGCGYQLTGIAPNQDCPECGMAIIKTLGTRVRPGIAGARGFGGWLRHTYNAIRRPTTLGTRLHVMSSDTGYRRSLIVTIALLILSSPIAMSVMFGVIHLTQMAAGKQGPIDDRWIPVSIIGGVWIGLLMTATTVGLALGGATVIGLIEGWRNERNLMPAAIRAACYQSGFIAVWSLVFWCNAVISTVPDELNMLRSITPNPNALIGFWMLGVAVIGIIIYLTLIYRATHAARHANW